MASSAGCQDEIGLLSSAAVSPGSTGSPVHGDRRSVHVFASCPWVRLMADVFILTVLVTVHVQKSLNSIS